MLSRSNRRPVTIGARSALIAGASLFALATGARAESQPAADALASAASASTTTVVQDVVVTATRQSTRIQKTPVAVSVIGQSLIASQNIVTTRDLAGQVPGVTIQRSGITPTTQVFFIRGIGNSDPIFDPNVAVYVDDVYLPRAINGMTDLTDIERVEILRGPQGTLFGENSDAGAIRYITKNPSEHPEFSADVGYGNYNAVSVHGYASTGIIPGLLAGNIALAYDRHDGYTWDPTIKKHVNNLDVLGARGKLLYTPTSKLSFLLTVDGTRDVSGSGYYIPKQPIIGGNLKAPIYGTFDPNKSYASQQPKNNSWNGGVAVKSSYQIDDHLTFNSISAFRAFAQDPVNYNNDGQPLVTYSPTVAQKVSISDNFIVYREKEATQEFQLIGNYGKFDFATGLYFLYEDFSSNRIGYVVSPTAATATPAYPEDQIGDTKTTNYAAYAQGNYHVTDKLTFTVGGRYTIEHRNFNFAGVYDDFNGKPLPVTPGSFAAINNFVYEGHKTWFSLTPKAGLSYQITPGVFSYFSYSQGFDAGGFNNRASSLATALPYNQETVTTYEAGLKTDWLEHRLRVNGTIFYNDYKGLQQTASVPAAVGGGYVSVRSNAGHAHTEGFELEVAAQPTDDLTLNANASYLSTRFDDFPNAAFSGGHFLSATGNQLPFSPAWQTSFAVAYRLPVDVHGDIRLGGDVTYESSYFSDLFNNKQGRVPSQAFLDAFVSYAPRDSNFKFSLTAKNLTNNIAYQSITWGGTPNLWQGPVSPPRTVFFKISYAR